MKHIRFEYDPDGLFTVSCIATKKVNIKKGDVIKIHGVSPKLDDVYLVDSMPSPTLLTPCQECPFMYEYTDADGFNDCGCRLVKKMDGFKARLCMGEDEDEIYTFKKLSDEMEDI